MVGVTKIQRGNAGYWLAAVAEGGEDYYNKPGEAPGEWIGELAADLGLSGQVEAEAYSAILEGTDPTSGKQLVARPDTRFRERPDGTQKRVEPVLGYDVRFSAPKSVSILYALGDEATRARVLGVVNEAVRQGLAHLEHEACFVQRGKGGQRIERGEGFVGMAFRHRMSRSGDPALHVHVVVSNLTRASSDGKWLSLASPEGRNPLWFHGKSAGVVFQAALRAGFVREFGIDFDAVKNGYADIAGFERDVIDALSTRSKEIAGWLEQHGLDSPEAAQVAAYRTRDKKDYGVDEDSRREEWIATAEPFGVTPESVGELVASGRPRAPRQVSEADLGRALAHLEATKSHFDRRALLWGLCDQLPEGADLTELVAAVDALLASDRIICVHRSSDPLVTNTYTTPRIKKLEDRLIEGALSGANAGAATADLALVARVLDQHPYLGDDQRAMIVRLTTGGERIAPVAALPGTGKTTALGAAREIWEAVGFPVIGCATARTASAELRDAGIVNATSIRALLRRADELRAQGITPLAQGTVIVMDEATMTATPDFDELRILVVECNGKLVPVGDERQIGAIGPGGVFANLTRSVEPARLTTIRRQGRPEDRQLVQLVHEGRGSEALDLLRTQDRIIVGDDLPATLDGMLTDWHRDYASGADVAMIARRNRDVDYLNDQARELRRAEGQLGSAEVIVGECAFAAGDRVQTRINREGVANRERWDVIGVNPGERSIALRRVGGDERVVQLDSAYLDRLRLDDNGPALEYAYALTKFGAQGKTLDRAYPLLDGGSSLEQELVALSRGREVAYVYAVASSELTDADLGPGRRELSDPLHNIRDTIEAAGNEYPAAEVKARRLINSLEPDELAARRAELQSTARAADPLMGRRDRLDRDIAQAEYWLAALTREHAALEASSSPPADELARVTAAEARTADRLRRALAEQSALPDADHAADANPRGGTDPETRLEAALIEERIDLAVRRQIKADRLEASPITYKTLGNFPHGDAKQSLAWHEGAHALHTYRHRHGITDDTNPFGASKPRAAAARAERARAQRRLQEAQRRLGKSAERSARRAASRAPTIGR
jgi:conjugative relaxase-like TrwC/TraI family protein